MTALCLILVLVLATLLPIALGVLFTPSSGWRAADEQRPRRDG